MGKRFVNPCIECLKFLASPRVSQWRAEKCFACPYPLNVQARPPREESPSTRSRGSGQEGERMLLQL